MAERNDRNSFSSGLIQGILRRPYRNCRELSAADRQGTATEEGDSTNSLNDLSVIASGTDDTSFRPRPIRDNTEQ